VAPQLNPAVIARRLGDGAVLVHLPSNRIFELNDTGMRVWELLALGLDVTSIPDHLRYEYADAARDITGEVTRLIDRLQAEGLLA
jgi:hypothetical protein